MSLNSFGIYEDAMEDVASVCEEVLEDAIALLKDYGTQDEVDKLHRTDLEEEVKECLSEHCDFDDFTNSFISAYFQCTTSALNDCPTFENLGIQFDSYTNCHDSHLYIETPQGVSRFTEKGDFANAFQETLVEYYADELSPLIADHLDASNEEYPREYLIQDLEALVQETDTDISYNLDDVKTAIKEGELTDGIIRTIEANAVPCEKETEKGMEKE